MTAIAQIPKGQSIRFATRFENNNNFDNLLGYEDNFVNSIEAINKDAFIYEVSKEQSVVYQILTNYDTITSKIYLNGAEQTFTSSQLSVTKKTSNIGASASESITLGEWATGETKIYFDGELPVWGIIGQSVTIADGGFNNGTYTISEVSYDDDLDGFVLIYVNTYVSGGSSATCATTYNIEDYEVYEVTIDFKYFQLPMSGDNVECYQIEHALTDTTYTDVTFLSEPIRHAQTDTDDMLEIKWSGSGTEFLVDYQYSQENEVHVIGDLFVLEAAGESTTYTDDEQKLYMLDGVYLRKLKLQIERLPRGICEQLALATQHTTFKVNDIEYATDEGASIERIEGNVLNNFEVTLQQVNLTGINTLTE